MKPHIEEALRMLRMAEMDYQAFLILLCADSAPINAICFHAQQAIEKVLKSALFYYKIEFRKTHDLIELGNLLQKADNTFSLTPSQLLLINPFAVTFRYDDLEIENISKSELNTWTMMAMDWARKLLENNVRDRAIFPRTNTKPITK